MRALEVSINKMTNICSGFQMAGIFPLNSEIFSDEDFVLADVTDRPFETAECQREVEHIIDTSDITDTEPLTDTENSEPVPVTGTSNDGDASMKLYLQNHNISSIPVSGDGHCLLYAKNQLIA